MKCEIHGTNMEYAGENPFGGDVWFCENCHAEEEANFQTVVEDEWLNEPFDKPGEDDDFLWFEPSEEEMDDLLDDGVYGGDEVVHYPYDDEED